MYWHGTYCIYSMVPIYLFLLYILGRYFFIDGGNLDLSLESIELETESRYEDKKSGDQIIGQ